MMSRSEEGAAADTSSVESPGMAPCSVRNFWILYLRGSGFRV
jgi:hypothetical protein